MEDRDLYTCITEHLPDILLDCIKRYLEIESNDQLRFDFGFFVQLGVEMGDYDEVYEVPSPERFTREALFESVSTPYFPLGDFEFGVYSGRKLVVEYLADPLTVYWKDDTVAGK